MSDAGNRVVGTRSVRTDQDINAGHSRGLAASLAKTEAEIRNLRTERLYAFDKNGKLIANSKTGTGNHTAIVDGYDYTDSIMTHNHPGNYFEGRKNFATRIGTSFSGDDIVVAVDHNVKEMRAVTRQGYTYSIKRKGDKWNIGNTPNELKRVRQRWRTLFNKNRLTYERALYGRMNGRESNQYMESFNDRVHIMSIHQTMKQLAKQYDFDYTRKKTK